MMVNHFALFIGINIKELAFKSHYCRFGWMWIVTFWINISLNDIVLTFYSSNTHNKGLPSRRTRTQTEFNTFVHVGVVHIVRLNTQTMPIKQNEAKSTISVVTKYVRRPVVKNHGKYKMYWNLFGFLFYLRQQALISLIQSVFIFIFIIMNFAIFSCFFAWISIRHKLISH